MQGINEISEQTKTDIRKLSKVFSSSEIANYLGIYRTAVEAVLREQESVPEAVQEEDAVREFKPHRYINGWVTTAEEEEEIWRFCEQVKKWFNQKYGGGKW